MFDRKHLLCILVVLVISSSFTTGPFVTALVSIQIHGEYCNETVQCQEHHDMFCVEYVCSCIDGRMPSSDKERCLKVDLYLGDACEEGHQCTGRLGAHSLCYDNICVCNEHAAPINGICEITASDADPSCEKHSQCSVFGDKSLCINSICDCMERYHTTATSKTCLENKGLTDQCDHDEDCFLATDGRDQHLKCIDRTCNCAEGYSPSDANHSCLKHGVSASYRITPLLPTTCLVFLLAYIV